MSSAAVVVEVTTRPYFAADEKERSGWVAFDSRRGGASIDWCIIVLCDWCVLGAADNKRDGLPYWYVARVL